MRIRSIRPEFWSSEDIAALDMPTRLIFIGLWSYVDDNGVGRDVEKLITADLLPLEEDPREALATVSGALQKLSDRSLITRFEVDGKPFLHITTWAKHQRVDKPAKDRYPLPTREDALIRETVARVSGDSRETVAPGEGEKGRRGEVRDMRTASLGAQFVDFWNVYPVKRDKANAEKAYRKQIAAGASHEQIMSGLAVYVNALSRPGAPAAKYAQGWLNGKRWEDEDTPTATVTPIAKPHKFYETPPAPPRESLPWLQDER